MNKRFALFQDRQYKIFNFPLLYKVLQNDFGSNVKCMEPVQSMLYALPQ